MRNKDSKLKQKQQSASETPDSDSSPVASAASRIPAGIYPIVDWLREHGLPVTLESYLSVMYEPGPIPDPLPAEVEMEIPEELLDEEG